MFDLDIYKFCAASIVCFMYNKNFRKDPTEKQVIGQIGEDSACKYLVNQGFTILDRNYLKKWGEIDIVAQNDGIMHFVEVKSVSRNIDDVTHETGDSYRPEDNMHPLKQKRLIRAIESYIMEKNVSDETDWQLDLAMVEIDKNKRLSRVSLLEDIIVE